jgi:hypothetical protein
MIKETPVHSIFNNEACDLSARPSSSTSMCRSSALAGYGVSRRGPSAESRKLGLEMEHARTNGCLQIFAYDAYRARTPDCAPGIKRIVEQGGRISAESHRRYDKSSLAQHISEACNQQSNRPCGVGCFLIMVSRSRQDIGWPGARPIVKCGLTGRRDGVVRHLSRSILKWTRASAALVKSPGLYRTI